MAQRIQVRPDDALSPQKLRPVASPDGATLTARTSVIDTFVAPSAKKNPYAGQQIAELARGLSSIAPSLARFAVQQGQEHNQDQYEKGLAAAGKVREAGLTFKKAVDSGAIPAHASPFFVAGAKEQLGEATANDFSGAWNAHVAASPELQQATDTSLYDAKLARFREEWMSENVGAGNRDQYFDSGFSRTADALVTNHRSRFAEQAGARLEEQAGNAHFTNTKSTLREDINNGVKPTDISGALTQKLADLRLQGMGGKVLAQQTGQAILSLADDMVKGGDADHAMELVDVVNGLKIDGKSIKDFDPQISSALSGLSDGIIKGGLEKQEVQRQQREVVQKDRVESAKVQLAQSMLSGDTSKVKDIIGGVSDIPDAVETLERTISSIRSTQDNPEGRTKAQREIYRNPRISVDDVFDMPGLGPNDVAYLVNQVQERDQKAERAADRVLAAQDRADRKEDMSMRRSEHAAAQAEHVLSSPEFRLEYRTINRRVTDMFSSLDPAATQDHIEEAEAQASLDWLTYASSDAGQKADPKTRLAWLHDHVGQIVETQRTALHAAIAGGSTKADATSAPSFKMPTRRVLTEDDILTRARDGKLTQHAKTVLDSIPGMPHDPRQLAEFFRTQAKITK